MILQTDRRLRPEINTFGCYFMSILFLANKYAKVPLSTVVIGKIFNDCVEMGYILNSKGYSAFIQNAEGIFKHLGLDCKYTNNHEPPKRNCSKNEFEILCLQNSKGKKHFVVGDGKGHIAYDPMGTSSIDYKLKSKRIFKRVL